MSMLRADKTPTFGARRKIMQGSIQLHCLFRLDWGQQLPYSPR